jgi:hypothetical protein
MVVLVMTLLSCVWVGAVFANPQGPFNPLKPPVGALAADTPTPSATIATPTDSIEFPTLPPVWTATFTPNAGTATPSATVTRTPRPSATVPLSPIGPTSTETEELTATPTNTVRAPATTQAPGSYPATAGVPTATQGSAYP